MLEKIKRLLAPPVFDDIEKTRTAAFLNGFLIAVMIGSFALVAGQVLAGIRSLTSAPMLLLLASVPLNASLIFIMRKGYVRAISLVFVVEVWGILTMLGLLTGGARNLGIAAYVIIILITAMLLGWRVTFVITGMSVIAAWGFAYLEATGLLVSREMIPYAYAVSWTIILAIITALQYVIVHSLTEARQLAEEQSQQSIALSAELDGQARRRADDLLNIADIGSTITQMRDVEPLMRHAVDMIQERYWLYHVQIYLLDSTLHGDRLILKAATGEVGERLLARSHQLPVRSTSSNGLAVLGRRAMLDMETAVSPTYRAHPLLPDTQSEIVVPLLVGTRVLGTLVLHHAKAGGFDEEAVLVFETIGSQIAAAIENALLFTRQQLAEEALRSSEALFGGVINNATAVIYIKHADGKYMLVNRRYEELFNVSNDEVSGKTDHDIFSADIADVVRQNDLAVLAQRETITSEEDIPHEDGMHTYISVKFPLLDEQGEAYAVAGISTDISEIKAVEIMLEERLAELDLFNGIGRKIEENSPVPEFLEWAATEIPTAMSHAEGCTASISWDGQLYGDADAGQNPRHIIEEMRVQSRHIGHITVAYDPIYEFENEDSMLIGGVGQRITAYLQTQFLLAQTQANNEDLQIVTEVGSVVSAMRDPLSLMQTTVDLIKEKFNLYHVHILILDELNQELLSTVGAGEVGAQLVANQHALHINNPYSLVARAALQRQPVVLNDVRTELNFVSHPLLPDVAAELAIPMQSGDILLGVLDVQSVMPYAFSEEKVIVYTTLATQIGIALQNAQQYERTQIALDEVNALQRAAAQEGWRTLAKQDGYVATADGVQVMTENGRLQIDNSDHIIMPMSVRGTQIGKIAIRADAGSLSKADQELLDSISTQVGEALERARFFEEIEQARHHTETLYNIGRVLPTIETNTELLRIIADGAAESINANQLLLLLCDVDEEVVEHTVAGGVGREKVDLDVSFSDIWNGLSGWTLRERKTAFAPKFMRDERESAMAHEYRLGHDVGSLIVVPLIYQDKILGTLTAINQLDQPDFSQAEVDLLTAFGIQATVAIENRNLLDETQKRAGREQTLRQITNRVNTAVDAESVLKTAVKEVGQAMGLEIFAYLDDTVSMDSSVDAKDVG